MTIRPEVCYEHVWVICKSHTNWSMNTQIVFKSFMTIMAEVCYEKECRVSLMVLNATFNNITAKSQSSVLLVEETRLPEENNRPVSSY